MRMIRRYGDLYYSIEKEKEIRKKIEEFVNEWGEYYLEHWKKERLIKKGWKEKKISENQTKYTYEFVSTCKSNYSKRHSTSESYVIIEV